MFPISFVIYSDFESFTEKIHNTQPNPEIIYTLNYQRHEPSGYCLYIKSNIPDINIKRIIYSKQSEDDVSLNFVDSLNNIAKEFMGPTINFQKRWKN